MIIKKDLIKEIKRQKREMKKGKRAENHFNFLGFVEMKELSEEVESYFKVVTPRGSVYYNWIDGTDRLKELINVSLKVYEKDESKRKKILEKRT